MSDGKGEALASELAALSVEEASAPPDGDGEKPSAEPAEGTDKGEKIKGVVSWFNVAKGFGACAWSFQRGNHLFFSERAFARRAVRAIRTRRGARCVGVGYSSPACSRTFDARSRVSGYARVSRDASPHAPKRSYARLHLFRTQAS